MDAEKEFTTVRLKLILDDIDGKLIKGNCDYEHLKAFHKYIFQDVYEWAGQQSTYKKIAEIISEKGYNETVDALSVFMQKEREHQKNAETKKPCILYNTKAGIKNC